MQEKCSNCGGLLYFSPKDKATVCKSCGSKFSIPYDEDFTKKSFSNNYDLQIKELPNELQKIKCKSCGANIVLSKLQMGTDCPYCGSNTLSYTKTRNMMAVDSIIPFNFSNEEAFNKLKKEIERGWWTDRKLLKNITQEDIRGEYCNAFVFDFCTVTTYSGIFSYERTTKDKDGHIYIETINKPVSGVFEKIFKDVTIEASAGITPPEINSILPFAYNKAVKFNDEFMQGYMLEVQDKMFKEAFTEAQTVVKRDIKRALLVKHNCDRIVTLSFDTVYNNKKYNYCLLPVYFISKKVKDKQCKVFMNGQTGKISPLPKNKVKMILTFLPIAILIVAIILLLAYKG